MIFKTEIGFGLCKLITYQLVEVLPKTNLVYFSTRAIYTLAPHGAYTCTYLCVANICSSTKIYIANTGLRIALCDAIPDKLFPGIGKEGTGREEGEEEESGEERERREGRGRDGGRES